MPEKVIAEIYQRYRSQLGENVGLQVAAIGDQNLLFCEKYGPDYRFFDIASLTKIVFMVPAMHWMVSGYPDIEWHSQVKSIWPQWPHETDLFQLITHQSGLAATKPFYQSWPLTNTQGSFTDIAEPDAKLAGGCRVENWQRLKQQLCQEKLAYSPGEESRYSDLGVLVLAIVLQQVTGKSLSQIWQLVSQFYGYPDELFFPQMLSEPLPENWIAPTEYCQFRRRVICGEVHDENCWGLGGITVHAGLFASLEAMVSWSHAILRYWQNHPDFANLTSKAISHGDWAMGFMTPSAGKSSCGNKFSHQSFGHTGFTGTSWWHDPECNLTVIVLTNRVHPSRDNKTIVELRPVIHNEVYEYWQQRKS